jgi:phosphoglucomutase
MTCVLCLPSVQAYEESLTLSAFKTVQNAPEVDLSASPGTEVALSGSCKVKIIDQFDCYMETLKTCFDFEKLKEFCQREDFTILFDGMHGAGGPFARRVLVDELGLPEVRSGPIEQCHNGRYHISCRFVSLPLPLT